MGGVGSAGKLDWPRAALVPPGLLFLHAGQFLLSVNKLLRQTLVFCHQFGGLCFLKLESEALLVVNMMQLLVFSLKSAEIAQDYAQTAFFLFAILTGFGSFSDDRMLEAIGAYVLLLVSVGPVLLDGQDLLSSIILFVEAESCGVDVGYGAVLLASLVERAVSLLGLD